MKGALRTQVIDCRIKKCPYNNNPRTGCGRCRRPSIEITVAGCVVYKEHLRKTRNKEGKIIWREQHDKSNYCT